MFCQEIIQGKLDQRSKCLEIDWTMGRDVASNQIEQLLETLSSWLTAQNFFVVFCCGAVHACVSAVIYHAQER